MNWRAWLKLGRGDDVAAANTHAEEARRLRLEHDELAELDTVFAPPPWLQDMGRTSWALVGFMLVVVALVWLLGTTYTIVGPVVVGTVVATVTMPLVTGMRRHRVPRPAGAAIVLLGMLALAVGVLVLVLAGIKDQSGALSDAASHAASKAESWLQSAGVNKPSADSANADVTKATQGAFKTLAHGVISGIRGLTSIAISASFLFLSIFFLLKDGPAMRAVVDRHLGVPVPVAQTVTGGVIRALRGYFKGVTIVALFNGVVVTLGALVLGVPLAGTIGLVTFILAYIPYIGAFVAGAFAVVIALGSQGTTTALLMLVIVILANGMLQQLVQPFAMGAALDLNPLVVLIVTIGAGCIFGTLGLILAAPLLSAAVHITKELDHARTVEALSGASRAAVPATDP